MTEIPESVMEEARMAAANIMDNACLGEHWVKNGVDAALRKDIKDALLAAEKRGEERERAYMKTVLREVIQQQKWGKGMPYESMLEHLEERAAKRKGSD